MTIRLPEPVASHSGDAILFRLRLLAAEKLLEAV
jgi:hypothetical protein